MGSTVQQYRVAVLDTVPVQKESTDVTDSHRFACGLSHDASRFGVAALVPGFQGSSENGATMMTPTFRKDGTVTLPRPATSGK